MALGEEKAHSLSSCPDAQISFLVPRREKTPSTLPQAPGCQPICSEKGGGVFPRGSWRMNWKIGAPRKIHLVQT